MRLEGRVALVTGAGRGIGRAIALALAREGAAVALTARTATEVESTAALARAAGARTFARVADLRLPEAVHELVRATENALGEVDLLVNNAGIVARARLEETTPAIWDDVLRTNLGSAFLCSRAVLPGMRKRRRGRIVNISSVSGREGTAMLGAYCSSKWGLVGLTKSLAEEVREDGIQVNAVCPGSVATAMLSQGMPGAAPDMVPEDVARVVLFLLADAPEAMTGAVLDVRG